MPDASTEGSIAPFSAALTAATHLTPKTRNAPMPTAYELMEAYRSWWRASYGTTPNSQAVILAAAWAEFVLSTYQAGQQPTTPARETTP